MKWNFFLPGMTTLRADTPLQQLPKFPLQNPRQAVSLLWKPMNCPSNA